MSRSFRLRHAAVLAVPIAAVAGYAYADIPDAKGVIHGCIDPNGVLSVIDPSKVPSCPDGSISIDWNQAGPTGAPGPAGPAGAAGPAGPSGPAASAPAGPCDGAAARARSSTREVPIPARGAGAGTTRFTMSLGESACKWFVLASVEITSRTQLQNYITCSLSAGSSGVIDSYTAVMRADDENNTRDFKRITLSGMAESSAGSSASVRCSYEYRLPTRVSNPRWVTVDGARLRALPIADFKNVAPEA